MPERPDYAALTRGQIEVLDRINAGDLGLPALNQVVRLAQDVLGGRGAGFAPWIKAHQLEAALFFAAYGGHTLEQVRTNLDKRSRAITFALEAQGLEPEALKARFMEAF